MRVASDFYEGRCSRDSYSTLTTIRTLLFFYFPLIKYGEKKSEVFSRGVFLWTKSRLMSEFKIVIPMASTMRDRFLDRQRTMGIYEASVTARYKRLANTLSRDVTPISRFKNNLNKRTLRSVNAIIAASRRSDQVKLNQVGGNGETNTLRNS